MLVHKNLNLLSKLGGSFAALLNHAEIFFSDLSGTEFFGQQIRCRNRILNRKIDSYSANGRHRVRRIPNAKQAISIPFSKVIDLDGEKLHIVPLLEFMHAVAQKRCATRDLLPKCFETVRSRLLKTAFSDHVSALPILTAVDEHHELLRADESKCLRWVVRLLRETEPEHIDWGAEIDYFESAFRPDRGTPSVGADDQIGADVQRPFWSGCGHSNNSLIFDKQVRDFGFHTQLELRIIPGMAGEKI